MTGWSSSTAASPSEARPARRRPGPAGLQLHRGQRRQARGADPHATVTRTTSAACRTSCAPSGASRSSARASRWARSGQARRAPDHRPRRAHRGRSRRGPAHRPVPTEFVRVTHSTPDCWRSRSTPPTAPWCTRATSSSTTRPSPAPRAATSRRSRAWVRMASCCCSRTPPTRGAAGVDQRAPGGPGAAQGPGDRAGPRHHHDVLLAHPPRAADPGGRVRRRPGRDAHRPVAHPQRRHRHEPRVPARAGTDPGEAEGPRRVPPRRAGHHLHRQPGRGARGAVADGAWEAPPAHPPAVRHDRLQLADRSGNELAVNDTINRIVRLGARFITSRTHPGIHVSGHGTSADLQWMLELIRPKFFAPIHGEPRHQRAHADLAIGLGCRPRPSSVWTTATCWR